MRKRYLIVNREIVLTSKEYAKAVKRKKYSYGSTSNAKKSAGYVEIKGRRFALFRPSRRSLGR